jgi:exopolyphosphatase/guanosine-5'-triphosphate,3'-diphosphate pyrophosphatase
LREGVLIDHLREIEAESLPPVPDVEDSRLRGVFAIGRRYGYEERHALHVADMAEKIFDAIAPKFELKRHYRTLLSAAALLHDVGYHISHESHHKHSFYLIKHSEITGFAEDEKLLIAHIARYHRGSEPKETHPDFFRLTEGDRKRVAELASIVRIADALDSGYEGRVRNIGIELTNGEMKIAIVADRECPAEIQAVERKKDLFEATFGISVSVG